MRLGVFGGTFDPPHVGHLLAASDAFEALALDRLLFVPTARHPLKSDLVRASAEQRTRMLELMVGDDARFGVDPTELWRAGPSYTVDTLAELASRRTSASLLLLIGADLAAQIGTWRQSARIASLAEIVVLTRRTDPQPSTDVLPMRWLATRRIDLSSTEIRARVRAGKSISGYVSAPVERFICEAGLYR